MNAIVALTEAEKIEMGEAYKGVEKMLCKLAHMFKGPISFEDAFSKANEVFMNAHNKWDPDKAKYTTWIYSCCVNGIKDEIRKQLRINCKQVTMSLLEDDNYSYQEPVTDNDNVLDLVNLIADLTEDAQYITSMILNGFKSDATEATDRRNMRTLVYNKLVAKGWQGREIYNAFEEIKRAIMQ